MADTNGQLWTKFNGKEFAARRAKYDWNGNELVPANDATITVKVADATTGPTAGTFTTNQATAGTITIPAAVSAPSGGSATPGVMSAADKEKLDGIYAGATKVSDSGQYGSIIINDDTANPLVVYVHPTAGPSTTTTAGETADKTLTFGGTFKVLQETVDTDGHTNVITERVMTMPAAPAAPNDAALSVSLAGGTATQWFTANADTAASVDIPAATTSAPGVMTATDKTNLDFAISVIPGSGDTNPATPSNKLAAMADIASMGGFEVVTGDPTTHEPVLPSGETPSTKIIYLVKDTTAVGDDKYFEWIYTAGGQWELIGDTSVDLSGYKTTQTAVTDPTASGTSVTFISGITQNANGVISPSKSTVATMGAASASADGTAGLVPAPQQNDQDKFLKGDGTWATVSTVDEKVKATADSTNSEFKLLATASASPTSGAATEAVYDTGITINPSTHTVTATTFDGNATTATTATDYNTTSGGIKTALDGKAGKPSSFTTGNLPEFDANGDLVDSGVAPDDFLTGVQLEGAQSALTPSAAGVVTVPNAISTGTSGATNGLLTADRSLILDQLQNWEYAEFTSGGAGADTPQTFPIQSQSGN